MASAADVKRQQELLELQKEGKIQAAELKELSELTAKVEAERLETASDRLEKANETLKATKTAFEAFANDISVSVIIPISDKIILGFTSSPTA